MNAVPRKIVIGSRLPRRDGNAEYLRLRRIEIVHRRFMCTLLIRWGRGFDIQDAPPDCNEWTRGRRLW